MQGKGLRWSTTVLLVSLAAFRVAGYLGVATLDNCNLPLRIALFLMFLVTASAHWGRGRPDLIRMGFHRHFRRQRRLSPSPEYS